MKVALFLFGVLVCASMTETSSVRWAKNHVRAMLKLKHTPTYTTTAPATTTTRHPGTILEECGLQGDKKLAVNGNINMFATCKQ